jgi:hypothetical protein
MALPVLLLAAVSGARMTSARIMQALPFPESLYGAAGLGYVVGVLTLWSAVRPRTIAWLAVVILYDLAMPVALFGMALLIEVAWGGQ